MRYEKFKKLRQLMEGNNLKGLEEEIGENEKDRITRLAMLKNAQNVPSFGKHIPDSIKDLQVDRALRDREFEDNILDELKTNREDVANKATMRNEDAARKASGMDPLPSFYEYDESAKKSIREYNKKKEDLKAKRRKDFKDKWK